MTRMRGDDRGPEAMFSCVSAEQRVPTDHPVRAIRALVDDMSRECDAVYARVGRPSIPPERALRAQLLQIGSSTPQRPTHSPGVSPAPLRRSVQRASNPGVPPGPGTHTCSQRVERLRSSTARRCSPHPYHHTLPLSSASGCPPRRSPRVKTHVPCATTHRPRRTMTADASERKNDSGRSGRVSRKVAAAREWALGAVRRHHLCPCVYRPQRGDALS